MSAKLIFVVVFLWLVKCSANFRNPMYRNRYGAAAAFNETFDTIPDWLDIDLPENPCHTNYIDVERKLGILNVTGREERLRNIADIFRLNVHRLMRNMVNPNNTN